MGFFYLETIVWSSLDHDLMASIWEKAISIWIQVVVILL